MNQRLVLCCLLLFACKPSQPKGPSASNDVGAFLTKEVSASLGVEVKVECPKGDLPYDCALQSADGKQGTLRAEPQGDNLRWVVTKADGDLLEPFITKQIEGQSNQKMLVDCPSGVPASDSFDCPVTTGGSGRVRVAFKADGIALEMFVMQKPTELSGDLVASTIADQLRVKTGLEFTVKCPDKVSLQGDTSTDCTTASPDGSQGKVSVSVGSDGNVLLTQSVSEISGASFAASVVKTVEEQKKLKLTVKCPEKILIKPGATAECSATGPDGSKGKVKVTVDEGGTLRWEVIQGKKK